MDAILICIENHNITYAAANNEPVLISDKNIIILEKDKMPVGLGEKSDNFNLFSIECKKGDMLYLYTDGFADQFGGSKGKKFKYKALNELLNSVSHLEVTEQYELINQTFHNWKADLEQVDDVCVIGIRI